MLLSPEPCVGDRLKRREKGSSERLRVYVQREKLKVAGGEAREGEK